MGRTHTCSNCGKCEPWSDKWMWYGSELELDEGKPIVKACSEECRKVLYQRGTTHTHSPGKPISKRKAAQLEAERNAERGTSQRSPRSAGAQTRVAREIFSVVATLIRCRLLSTL